MILNQRYFLDTRDMCPPPKAELSNILIRNVFSTQIHLTKQALK